MLDCFLHVAQICSAVARFVLGNNLVDMSYDRLAVPLRGTAVPVVKANLAAEMQHQGFKWRCGIKLKPNRVQFFFGRQQFRAEAAQILHQHQRMLLLLVEPH